MTLCIAWRDPGSRVRFFSDSRVNLGSASSDFGIKVVRMPYNIYSANTPEGGIKLLQCGDIGIMFAGTTVLPLMIKETLAEVVSRMQAVPQISKYDMAAIAEFIFAAFNTIAADAAFKTNDKISVGMIFGGWCDQSRKHRIYRMEVTRESAPSYEEILQQPGDVQIIGTGKQAAEAILERPATMKGLLQTLQAVIDDDKVDSVGGNINFGEFDGNRFQPYGTLKIDNGRVHYWRGMLDLNEHFFSGSNLVSNFPLIDLQKI